MHSAESGTTRLLGSKAQVKNLKVISVSRVSSTETIIYLIGIAMRAGVCSSVVAPTSAPLTRIPQNFVGATTQRELRRAHSKHDTRLLTSGGGQRKNANTYNIIIIDCAKSLPTPSTAIRVSRDRTQTTSETNAPVDSELFSFPSRTPRPQRVPGVHTGTHSSCAQYTPLPTILLRKSYNNKNTRRLKKLPVADTIFRQRSKKQL